jgi:hypothetical protein
MMWAPQPKIGRPAKYRVVPTRPTSSESSYATWASPLEYFAYMKITRLHIVLTFGRLARILGQPTYYYGLLFCIYHLNLMGLLHPA